MSEAQARCYANLQSMDCQLALGMTLGKLIAASAISEAPPERIRPADLVGIKRLNTANLLVMLVPDALEGRLDPGELVPLVKIVMDLAAPLEIERPRKEHIQVIADTILGVLEGINAYRFTAVKPALNFDAPAVTSLVMPEILRTWKLSVAEIEAPPTEAPDDLAGLIQPAIEQAEEVLGLAFAVASNRAFTDQIASEENGYSRLVRTVALWLQRERRQATTGVLVATAVADAVLDCSSRRGTTVATLSTAIQESLVSQVSWAAPYVKASGLTDLN